MGDRIVAVDALVEVAHPDPSGGGGVHVRDAVAEAALGQPSGQAVLHGRALALAIAADRAAHVETEIIPRLDDGLHVVTDRYVPSSLVLQRIDGLDLNEIWSYNRYVLPAVTIYLEDDPRVIRDRLTGRSALTRLEVTGTPKRELAFYRDAERFLRRHDWQQHTVDCHSLTPDEVVTAILGLLP